jgi:hypothetical protein
MNHKWPARTLHIYVFISLLLFIGVELLKYLNFDLPNLLINHLNDFLTLPMVATPCLHAVWLIKKDKSIRLSMLSIFSLVVLYSFYFEYYLPIYVPRYTGDLWDVFCYLSGGILFYVLQKAP